MKNIVIGIIVFFSLTSQSQNTCDTSLFQQLHKISQQDKVDSSDLFYSKRLVDTLSYGFCDHIITQPDSIYTCLTYTYGSICLKANSEQSVKFFIEYRLDHIGSAEELLSFTLENIFIVKPDIVLQEIFKLDSSLQIDLLNDLAWGFLNNRIYGENDPFEFNPFKAMTYYENLPDPVLNSNNYKDLFYKVNPKTEDLYNKYNKLYDFILKGIYDALVYQEENRKE